MNVWIFGILEFGPLDTGNASCCFVFCLFVVLCIWYTFVVSSVFLRVPKTESDFRCTVKAEFTDY